MRAMGRKILVMLMVLLLSGALRLSFEADYAEDLRAKRLLEQQVDATTREKLGQRTAFIALGGLRSLVASWRAMIAFDHFDNGRWFELEQEYRLITTLVPHDEYHWQTGAWHLGYNAAGYYSRQDALRPVLRKRLMEGYVERGRQFFLDGIRYNPDSWRLKGKLAMHYLESEVLQDHSAAADWFIAATEAEESLGFYRRAALYSMVRVKERDAEAYERLLKELDDPSNHVPTMLCLKFVLGNRFGDFQADLASAEKVFGSLKEAEFHLGNYAMRGNDWPRDGVAVTLEKLKTAVDAKR